MPTLLRYSPDEVAPYINWLYFFHAWGFQPRFAAIAHVHDCRACREGWLAGFSEEERPKAVEAMQLYDEAQRTLRLMDGRVTIQALFCLCRANSIGDDLSLTSETEPRKHLLLPLLRQQTAHGDAPYLCLSDFIRPMASGIADRMGLFATSVSSDMEDEYRDDPYLLLLIQTLSDRLAEAATERMHLHVRREAWGYAPDERLTIPELLEEKFQGIRPAVGYPSLPDQSVNFLLDDFLDMKRAGITLTEHGAMHPHASVCGLMLAHTAARYFAVGKIDEEQLHDYARRRGMPVEDMRKFLAANL